MNLSSYGEIVQMEWKRSAKIRAEIDLDVYQVMPNHFHGIVVIKGTSAVGCNVGANGRSPLQMKPKSLSSLLAGFKASATLRINKLRKKPGTPVWQRSYYERIIRDEGELNLIRDYIVDNPIKWHLDKENPDS